MANVQIFDCQYDSTNLTNSFVIGRASTSNDCGNFISAKDFEFEDGVFIELESSDYELDEAIKQLGWMDLYTDNDGTSLGLV